jgi:hypothetical protein
VIESSAKVVVVSFVASSTADEAATECSEFAAFAPIFNGI